MVSTFSIFKFNIVHDIQIFSDLTSRIEENKLNEPYRHRCNEPNNTGSKVTTT